MENNSNMPQRPMLKKVKRPINRMPQSAPMGNSSMGSQQQSSPQRPPMSNPFVQQVPQQPQKPLPDVGDDAFDLDAYLDDEQLPANSVAEPVRNDNPQFLQEEDWQDDYPAYAAAAGADLPPYLTKKILILIGAVLFFLGIITTKLFFTDSKVVRDGLQGVVVNPEVPKGRARCGVAERTQGCVLYIMNPQRQELNARDFYDLAAQMTGRQRFVIETGNMRYSNTKIRPGSIAQINIPPL